MRHLIIYIACVVAMIVASCSHSQKQEVAPEEDTISISDIDNSWKYEQSTDTTPSVSITETKAATQAKPVEDNRSFYQRGYDEGYDNGREDGVMDLGDGYSYNDANPYKGTAKREYERGYRHGYRKGYNAGFYEYSDGDEEEYDEW